MTARPLQPYGYCSQSDNCHEDSGPTIHKTIIVSRHVGKRHRTTNQRNIEVLELMMMMVIIVLIIIIIIGMSIPNTQNRPKIAGGNHRKKTRTHTMPQGGRGETTSGPHHTTGRGKQPTTPQEGGTIGGGGGGRTGIICRQADMHE